MSERNVNIDLLQGKGIKGAYIRSNLLLINKGEKTIEQKTSGNICPPINLNSEHLLPISASGPSKKKRRQEIDKKPLQQFLN